MLTILSLPAPIINIAKQINDAQPVVSLLHTAKNTMLIIVVAVRNGSKINANINIVTIVSIVDGTKKNGLRNIKMVDKVLIEKYKGFEICYDKEKERFVADKQKLNIHFEARTLWQIKGYITESQKKEVNEYYYIISGYFDKSISKIHLMTKNKTTKRCDYEVLDDTEKGYDVGRVRENEDMPKLYPINEHNTKIFDSVARLEKKIKEIEQQQEELVESLKK